MFMVLLLMVGLPCELFVSLITFGIVYGEIWILVSSNCRYGDVELEVGGDISRRANGGALIYNAGSDWHRAGRCRS
jgi:hypothetical protein